MGVDTRLVVCMRSAGRDHVEQRNHRMVGRGINMYEAAHRVSALILCYSVEKAPALEPKLPRPGGVVWRWGGLIRFTIVSVADSDSDRGHFYKILRGAAPSGALLVDEVVREAQKQTPQPPRISQLRSLGPSPMSTYRAAKPDTLSEWSPLRARPTAAQNPQWQCSVH